jgi:prophage maintenance system killer protein
MRYLALSEVLALHRAVLEASGGSDGLRDLGLLEPALAQPRAAGDMTREQLTDWLETHLQPVVSE